MTATITGRAGHGQPAPAGAGPPLRACHRPTRSRVPRSGNRLCRNPAQSGWGAPPVGWGGRMGVGAWREAVRRFGVVAGGDAERCGLAAWGFGEWHPRGQTTSLSLPVATSNTKPRIWSVWGINGLFLMRAMD